jgi:hypothetical protein
MNFSLPDWFGLKRSELLSCRVADRAACSYHFMAHSCKRPDYLDIVELTIHKLADQLNVN